MYKRALALLIIIIFAFQTPLFTYADDIAGHKDENAFRLLIAMQLLRGDDTGKYNPEEAVTRAEFTALVLRMLGLEDATSSVRSSDIIFSDVDNNHWAYPYIFLAKEIGIVEGTQSNRFDPDSDILQNEAAKVLVCSLGYKFMAEQRGGYPVGYNYTASSIGLTKGLAQNEEFTRAGALRMIFNSLFVNTIDDVSGKDSGKTVLEMFHGFKIFSGIVTGTYKLQKERRIRKDYIEISDTLYKAPLLETDELIGAQVRCYSKETGGEEVIYHIDPLHKQSSITLSADEILEKTTLTKLYYAAEDEQALSVALAEDLEIYYNGEIISQNDKTIKAIMPDAGNVVLRDTDFDGVYDIAVVKDFKNYVVSFIGDDAIYDKFDEALGSYDDAELLECYKNGKTVLIEDIKNGDVLSVAKSRSGKSMLIYINNSFTVGSVTEIINLGNEKVYKIKGEEESELKLAENYKSAIKGKKTGSINIDNNLGKEYKFYFDAFGKIADITKTEEDAESYGYLYQRRLSAKSSLNAAAEFEILTANNRFEVFKTTPGEKTIFGRKENGVYKISAVTAEQLIEGAGEKQIVKYVLNGARELKELYLADNIQNAAHFSKADIAQMAYAYYEGIINQRWYVDDKTVIFATNVNARYKDIMYAGNYANTLHNGISSDMIFYDFEDNYVKAIVMSAKTVKRYDLVSDGYEFVINYVNSPLLYINKVFETVGADGETYTCLNGYEGKKEINILVERQLKPNSEPKDNLKAGTVIQYVLNDVYKGRAMNVDEEDKLIVYKTVFDFTQPDDGGVLWEYTSIPNVRPRISTMWGTVIGGGEAYCSLNVGNDYYTASVHDGTAVMEYLSQSNEFKPCTASEINKGQKVFLRQRYLNTREIVIYER